MHEKVLSRVVRPYERHGRARTGTRHRHGSVLGDRLRPETGPIPSGQPPLGRRAGTHAEWLGALSPARARARYFGLVHPSRIHDGTSLCLPAAAPAGPYGRGARDHRGASRSWGGSRRAPPHAQRRSDVSHEFPLRRARPVLRCGARGAGDRCDGRRVSCRRLPRDCLSDTGTTKDIATAAPESGHHLHAGVDV